MAKRYVRAKHIKNKTARSIAAYTVDDYMNYLTDTKKIIKNNLKTMLNVPYKLDSFLSGREFLKALSENVCQYNLVFLDIEMPGMNGIYVGNELKKANKNVIIFVVTSYSEYLDEAMRFHVFRYLSKPLERQRFFRNMQDAVNLYHTSTLLIPVETKNGVHAISATDIIVVEAAERKVMVYTVQKSYESVRNMAYWLDTLPKSCFFQTHRSFIINLGHITDFDHTLIHLTNQLTAYLTRRKYRTFKDAYLLYLESMR